MSKVTGLASFTKRSIPAPTSPETSTSALSIAATAATRSTNPEPRERGLKSQVAMTFRLPRQEWERLHQLALTEGVSINTLTLRGLSRLFEERGLPGVRN